MNRTSCLIPPGTLTSTANKLRFARPWIVSQLDPIRVTVRRDGWSRERFCSSETTESYVWNVVGAEGSRPVGEMTPTATPGNPVRIMRGTARIAIQRARAAAQSVKAHLPKADEQNRDARRDRRHDSEGRQRRDRALADHLIRNQAGDDESDHLEPRLESADRANNQLDGDGERHRRQHRDRETAAPEQDREPRGIPHECGGREGDAQPVGDDLRPQEEEEGDRARDEAAS